MSQLSENPISEEDFQLTRICHLENPLKVFRASSRYICSAYVSGLTISAVTTLLCILLVLAGHVTEWPSSLTLYISGAFVFVIGATFGLTSGPDARKTHLIVCEIGLLLVRNRFRHNRIVQVMYYRDIKKIQKAYLNRDGYYIKHRGGKPFIVSASYYQNADELLALIRERITETEKEL